MSIIPNREMPKAEDGLTNGLYGAGVLEYERGQLRRIFEEKMRVAEPRWLEEHRLGKGKRDFELAVRYCVGEFSFGRVREWVDAFHDGGSDIDLEKVLFPELP